MGTSSGVFGASLIGASALLAGCATILCTFGKPQETVRPYDGTRCSLAYLALPSRDEDMGDAGWVWWLGLLPLVVLDLPLSAAGDTLLLPYTLTVDSGDEAANASP